MKKKTSRIGALLLTVCMVVFGLPVSAFAAAEIASADALSEAFAAGGEYQLTSDITVDTEYNWVVDGQDVVLDLNGHSITSTYADSNHYIIVIQNGGSLTINDSSAGGTGKIAATDGDYGYGIQLRGTGSSFTLNSGTIETTQESLEIYDLAQNTSVTIAGGQLISTQDNVLGVRGSGTQVNITGGDMTSGGQCGVYISSFYGPGVSFTMTGGTLTHSGGINGAIQAFQNAAVTIGGDAELTSTNKVLLMQGNTVLNVEGGTMSTTGTENCFTVKCSDESVVNISGGFLSSASRIDPVVLADGNATVSISGGTFDSSSTTAVGVPAIPTGGDPSIIITGGNFNKSVDKYLAPGFERGPDGEVSLKDGVRFLVDGGGYETIAEAVAALKDGSVMEIMPGEYDVTATRTNEPTYGSCFIIDEDNVTIKAREPENKPVLYGFSNKYSGGAADGGINGQDTIYVSGKNVTLENLVLMPLGGYPDGNGDTFDTQKTVEVTADATGFTMTGCETLPNTKEKDEQSGANSMAALSGLIHVSTDDAVIKKNSFGEGTTICAGWKTVVNGKPTSYYQVDVSENYWGADVAEKDIKAMLDGAAFENYYVDEAMTKLKSVSSTPSQPTIDDDSSPGYSLPSVSEGTRNFVSDTTSSLTVNGKYQFRITSLDGHKPVMTLSSANFTVELASQNGNDYFYAIRCVGAVGSTANVLVDGRHVVTATVGTAGVVSDTTQPFTVTKGSTYQFKLTSASRPVFTGNNANFTVTYAGNSGSDWFFKVTAVGATGASTTFSANDVVVTTATIA